MKVKRFNNLWAMGLILCGVLLVAFYIAKIFFPQFIIGIAETPRLVEIGKTIQSNKGYLHLFNFTIGYIHGYIMCCACCRKHKLNWKGNFVLMIEIILLRIIAEFYPLQYSSLNIVGMAVTPFIICAINKDLSRETFISTICCFGIEFAFEFLSLVVRDLTSMTANPNVVSFLVLLIDLFIWRIMLYLFFNYKNKESNENGI